MRPGDRRDGQPLIFGWGRHLTRAEKQKARERFVLAGGIFIFGVIVLVLGVGAFQQYFMKPRAAVATVNGDGIERQWYDKNVAYTQFVYQREALDLQSQGQALAANQKANAAATAAANPETSAAPSPEATVAPSAGATPDLTLTPTPAPTFNPQEAATVTALQTKFAADQARISAVQQQTLEELIDSDLMRQNAAKLGINVSDAEVSAQAKKVTDLIGGEAGLKQLFQAAHLSQADFNRIQYDTVLRDKFEAYFAAHPEVAPTPSPTAVPTPSPTLETTGPIPPTATPSPTPVPTPGADSLDRWLDEQRKTAKISRAPFPLPS